MLLKCQHSYLWHLQRTWHAITHHLSCVMLLQLFESANKGFAVLNFPDSSTPSLHVYVYMVFVDLIRSRTQNNHNNKETTHIHAKASLFRCHRKLVPVVERKDYQAS